MTKTIYEIEAKYLGGEVEYWNDREGKFVGLLIEHFETEDRQEAEHELKTATEKMRKDGYDWPVQIVETEVEDDPELGYLPK